MARQCDICGKSAQHGFSVSHSKRHTKRVWLPNVHPATVLINGQPRKVYVCTRCRRTQRKLAA